MSAVDGSLATGPDRCTSRRFRTVHELLLFLHVTTAILFIGPATYATSTFARHLRAPDAGAAAQANRASRVYGIGSLVVAVLGIVLALDSGGFGRIWVDTALSLFLVAALVLLAGHLPAQRRALAALADGRPCGAGVVTRLRATAGLYSLTWVAIVWLMVTKPA
jgi:uncharacterized membrane protein